MNFDNRLKRAIERGEKTKDAKGREARAKQLSLAELRTLHSGYRIELTEHIDQCLRKLSDHIPGFRFQSVVADEGWGGRVTRDDLKLTTGKGAESLYSRMEVLVTPFQSEGAILEVTAKGTVRNREVLNRKHYQKLEEFDLETFKEIIDQRVLEFAEQYTSVA